MARTNGKGIPVPLEKRKVRKKGKKNRKHGRNKRKPSAKRYLSERRWEVNKARRAAGRARQFPLQVSR